MTPSKIPSPFSIPDMQTLEGPMRGFLRGLCADPGRHARFLNTLSLLEHIGSRKIMLSRQALLGEDVLRHLAEETRHAHFFRRAAEKMAGRPLDYGEKDAAAPASARKYFGRLDAAITRQAGAGGLPYLYVTLAVELRAAWLYALYDEILRSENSSLFLRGVIAEEDAHLSLIQGKLRREDSRHDERSARFVALESRLFGDWFDKVQRALEAS